MEKPCRGGTYHELVLKKRPSNLIVHDQGGEVLMMRLCRKDDQLPLQDMSCEVELELLNAP